MSSPVKLLPSEFTTKDPYAGIFMGDSFKVEHVFILQWSNDDKWKKILRRTGAYGLAIIRHYAEKSVRLLTLGMAAYVVLTGTAKLLELASKDDDANSSSSSE
jgi:hypothetical protein